MSSRSLVHHSSFFERLMARPENNVCFDCGAENPTMAALLYGACDIHLTFKDSSISVVRPIYFDDWPIAKLSLMIVGGNDRARVFFEQHGWIGGGDLEAKYSSEAATLYRTKLSERVKGPLNRGLERFKRFSSPDLRVTEDLKKCTLEEKNPETSPAISRVNLIGCKVNKPPAPICSVQNRIEQDSFQVKKKMDSYLKGLWKCIRKLLLLLYAFSGGVRT